MEKATILFHVNSTDTEGRIVYRKGTRVWRGTKNKTSFPVVMAKCCKASTGFLLKTRKDGNSSIRKYGDQVLSYFKCLHDEAVKVCIDYDKFEPGKSFEAKAEINCKTCARELKTRRIFRSMLLYFSRLDDLMNHKQDEPNKSSQLPGLIPIVIEAEDSIPSIPEKYGNPGWNVGSGLTNVHNSCYLNSTIQALFHIPAFVNFILSDKGHCSTGLCCE